MTLTTQQRLALAHRIADEFSGFISSELEYQVEDMKDNDELAHSYYILEEDREDIMKLVIDMIAVPVS